MNWLQKRRGHRAEVGRLGEKVAARYLRRRGYRILHKNYITPYGEIDLIAERHEVCIFVEVKTSIISGSELFQRNPADRVDPHKRSRMRAAARLYLANFEPIEFAHRFDVIAVEGKPGGKFSVLEHRVAALDPLPPRNQLPGWQSDQDQEDEYLV
jgi:putative endonuclease